MRENQDIDEEITPIEVESVNGNAVYSRNQKSASELSVEITNCGKNMWQEKRW